MKKLIAIVLTLCMTLSLLAVPAWATGDADSQEPIGYQPVTPTVTSGDNIADGLKDGVTTYIINSVAGLQKLSEIVNNSATAGDQLAGYQFYLTADINVDTNPDDDVTPTPMTFMIGGRHNDANKHFAASFDGQGYTIDYWQAVSSASHCRGLFGIASTGTIQNLQIGEHCTATGPVVGTNNYGCGGLVGYGINGLTVSNVNVKMTIDANNSYKVGGIVGAHQGGAITLQNCTFDGVITNGYEHVGGILAFQDAATVTIKNCENKGSVSGQTNVGGILGYRNNRYDTEFTITNCVNRGTVASTFAGASFVGGIVGLLGNSLATITNCENSGTVTTAGFFAGGMAGRSLARLNVNGFTNTGTVSSTYAGVVESTMIDAFIGEIAAYNGGSSGQTNYANLENVAENVTNTGTVTGTEGVGGGEVAKDPYETENGTGADTTNGVGYLASRIEKKDLTNVIDILLINDLPTNVNPTEYKVTSAEGLIMLDKAVRLGMSMAGYTVYLANDIDMAEYPDFNGINGAFAGHFDGQGHIIDNVVVKNTKVEKLQTSGVVCVGFFNMLTGGSEKAPQIIKNLVLGAGCEVSWETVQDEKAEDGTIISTGNTAVSDMRMGCVAGQMKANTVIDNCYVASTINGKRFCGGFVGMTESQGKHTITNSTFAGVANSDAGNANIAAFVGTVPYETIITNCRNIGAVNASGESMFCAAAVFVGRSWGLVTIDNCINNGPVTSEKDFAYSLMGKQQIVDGTSVTNCTNYGELKYLVGSQNVGLIGGFLDDAGKAEDDNYKVTTENLINKIGEEDPTLAAATLDLTLNVPSEEELAAALQANREYLESLAGGNDGDGGQQPGGDGGSDGQQPGGDGSQGGTNTGNNDNNQNNEQATTGAVATTPAPVEEEGCGSTIGGALVILLTAGAALTVCKKKKED